MVVLFSVDFWLYVIIGLCFSIAVFGLYQAIRIVVRNSR